MVPQDKPDGSDYLIHTNVNVQYFDDPNVCVCVCVRVCARARRIIHTAAGICASSPLQPPAECRVSRLFVRR